MISRRSKKLLFPTPIWIGHISLDMLIGLSDYLYDMKSKGSDFGEQRRNVWKSSNMAQSSDFMELKTLLAEETAYAMRDYDVAFDSIYLNNIWAQIGDQYWSHQEHHHPNSYFSGILYLKTPEGSGQTGFTKPGDAPMIQLDIASETYNDINMGRYWETPVEGKYVIFPSWLRHSVDYGNHEGDRITLSWTAMPKATVNSWVNSTASIIY